MEMVYAELIENKEYSAMGKDPTSRVKKWTEGQILIINYLFYIIII